jgi:hypothetical protein
LNIYLLRFALVYLSLLITAVANAQSLKPDLVLDGSIEGKQDKTYFEIPFEVPANIHRLSVDFLYTGREAHTALNLGIADPFRFRGNSGGNKSRFTISETDATPSYLPGAIPAGQWRLLISVPNIRSAEHARYHTEIRFNSPEEDRSFTLTSLAAGLRWYRGDLHMHTAHSDGSCLSQSGKSLPCPVFLTAQTAAARGLDFIAITDHNTDSQYNDERQLQPYFDKLLLIPGREMTTFWGHFNIFGVTQYVDYRAVSHDGLDINAILRDVRTKGGVASINHADSPGGEDCMGCRWEPPTKVDMNLLTGIEVINGGRSMLSSADFWDRQLADGNRLTAIGGSDNHNAPSEVGRPGAIGWPTTVVEATELSVPAILDGIRHGRVFIDLTASHDKVVDLTARDTTTSSELVQMGSTLNAAAGDTIAFIIKLTTCPRAHVHLFLDGEEKLPPLNAIAGNDGLTFQWKSDARPHWLRAEVRDSNESLMLVSNPIYIHPVTH